MTTKSLKELTRLCNELDMDVSCSDGEYRVNFKLIGTEATAYYTEDWDDALGTAKLMAERGVRNCKIIVLDVLQSEIEFSEAQSIARLYLIAAVRQHCFTYRAIHTAIDQLVAEGKIWSIGEGDSVRYRYETRGDTPAMCSDTEAVKAHVLGSNMGGCHTCAMTQRAEDAS